MNNIEIISATFTGIISSLIFNPIDKAIYISTNKNISIFNKNVWSNSYKGTYNTILTRLITSGLYFSIIDNLSSKYSVVETSIITSLLCNSLTNPIQLIKFHSWYNNLSLNESYKYLYKTYGIRGFGIGFSSIVLRDICFNISYITFKKKDNHIHNLSLISLTLIAVSPLNLIKNKKYGNNEKLSNILKNFKFSQLGITQSILRTSISFYFSQFIYDYSKDYFSKIILNDL